MDKKVRNEAKALLRDTRRLLRRVRGRLSQVVIDKIEHGCDQLEDAWTKQDVNQMRAGIVAVDALADAHLSIASKPIAREYAESIVVAILIAAALRLFVVEAFKIPSGSMLPTLEIGDHIFVNKLVYGLRIPGIGTKLFDFRKPRRGEVIVFINPCTPERDFIKRIVATEGDSVEVRCGRVFINGEQIPSKLIDNQQCKYWDLPETESIDWFQTACARHTETVGMDSKINYDVIYSPPLTELAPSRSTLSWFPKQGEESQPACLPPRSPQAKEAAEGQLIVTRPKQEVGRCEPWFQYIVPKGHVFVMGDHRTNSNDSRAWGPVPVENIRGKALFIFMSNKRAKPTGILWHRIGQLVH